MYFKNNEKGFTLIEVLFALILLGWLGIYFHGFFNKTILDFRKQNDAFQKRQQARLALERMIIDLKSGQIIEVSEDSIVLYAPYKGELTKISYLMDYNDQILRFKSNKNFSPLINDIYDIKFQKLNKFLRIDLTVIHSRDEKFRISTIISEYAGERQIQ
ncbi:MAG: prepilin-type N-terminal cleavage/methylation domain-containing protein [Bacillota bacterium]